MAYTINWDQVSSLSRNKHVPKLKDNFFLSNALMHRWRGKQKEWQGGPVLVVPLGFAPEGGGGAWYAGSDKFDTTVRNPIKAANYFAKNAQVTLAIDGDEELACNGPNAVLDLLEKKMKIAESTALDLVGTALFNNGSNAKAIGGLQLALPDNITVTSQTYGGITCGGAAPSADTNGWWQPNSDNAAYTTGSTGTFFGNVAGAGPMSTMFARIGLRSGKQPTVIVSNWGSWTDYHNSLAKNERYDRPNQSTEMAKAGFTNLMYRNAPWVVDERAPRGPAATYIEKVYVIDEKALSLYTHPARDFSFDGWRKAYDQDARVSYIFHRTELGFDERRSSGCISNVDTSAVLAV
jgi:hypothetical protein